MRKTLPQTDELWVICGPVFYRPSLERIEQGVALPVASFMIVVDEAPSGLRSWAVEVPQTVSGTESIQSFRVSIDTIEALTGLDFFPDLPDEVENAFEKAIAPRIW